MERTSNVVIIGGGPGGYEAALVAAQLGAHVTVIDRDGLGGAAVLTDCVPSKALISTAAYMTRLGVAGQLGVEGAFTEAHADLTAANQRILDLAAQQSQDIAAGLVNQGVEIVPGVGRIIDPSTVQVTPHDGSGARTLPADVILVATGATPRVLPTAVPDGERILTWKDIYALQTVPPELIVIGSGVTGAELAHAYLALGSKVTLVSSREQILPGEDVEAAAVIEKVFRDRGMTVLDRSRANAVERTADGVTVTLADGRRITGSHALMAVGSIPATRDLGLEEVGMELTESGHIAVDRVSRTSVRGVYAAGDCTAALPLASVAAMQGRTAMWHALGDAVAPLNLHGVCANIFTDPEIATVGVSEKEIADKQIAARTVHFSFATNPRAKMDRFSTGFVKLFAADPSGVVIGGVIVAPKASELIFPVALAVTNRLTVDQMAQTLTVYPSMSGSVAEAARRLHSAEH